MRFMLPSTNYLAMELESSSTSLLKDLSQPSLILLMVNNTKAAMRKEKPGTPSLERSQQVTRNAELIPPATIFAHSLRSTNCSASKILKLIYFCGAMS